MARLRLLLVLALSLLLMATNAFSSSGNFTADQCSVTWTDLLAEPGKSTFDGSDTYLNSMPVGNGHVAANVLYEAASHSITVLISASSAYDEAGNIFKVALLTVALPAKNEDSPIGDNFQQVMDVATATVKFQIGGVNASVWVDAHRDVLLVKVDGAVVTPTLVDLRTEVATVLPPFACLQYNTSVDVASSDNLGQFVYHRNNDVGASGSGRSLFHKQTLGQQNIPDGDDIADPLALRNTGAHVFTSPSANGGTLVGVAILTAQTATGAAFEAQLLAAANSGAAATTPDARTAHTQWWSDFWARSYITVESNPGLSQHYCLQRFLQAMQARVAPKGVAYTPIKFNGQLFTANRQPNADYRDWGGLNWWQNMRLPYYNMLAAGDDDMLLSLLIQFNTTLPLVRARTKAYFGFDGLWWPEYTHPLYGTTHAASYGCNRTGEGAQPATDPIWHSDDRWNGYNRQGSLDLSLFILDHLSYTQQSELGLLAIPEGVVEFYNNRWSNTSQASADGKISFFPTQALETWECPGWPVDPTDCPTNDLPTIAGLHMILSKLLALPASLTTPDKVAAWKNLLAILPSLPTANGAYIPCDNCDEKADPASPGSHRTSNSENAELYSVHPYRLATAARGDKEALQLALTAFANKKFTDDKGWNQNAMDAALLGLAEEAKNYVLARASTAPAKGYRFPAFAPHEQDYEPSSDHFSVMSNALQYMVMAPKDDADEGVVLLPAWPCEWDVSFKLHAPRQTVVEGQLVGGNLTFTVTPEDRKSAVTAFPCQE